MSSFCVRPTSPSAAYGFRTDADLAAAASAFAAGDGHPPELLALGEPTHLEPAFPELRNRLFALLVEHGFRSIALESDAVAALDVAAFVNGDGGTLDGAMGSGFSHGFGRIAANRELVAWMRTRNDTLPPAERLAFYGIDAPLEMDSAPSPRRSLTHLHGYLLEHLGPALVRPGCAELDRLLGADERWSDPAAVMDAAASVGASPAAHALRAVADDMVTALWSHAPALVAATSTATWEAAAVHGRAASGLLRYHATLAVQADPAARWSAMGAVRAALMAENLLAVRAREQHRGPTLVFAHNAHLQRHPSSMQMGPIGRIGWFGTGAILAGCTPVPCTLVVGSLGASTTKGLDAPDASTFEGALERAAGGSAVVTADRLAGIGGSGRADAAAAQGYAPLSTEDLRHCDAVLHVAASPGGTRVDEAAPEPSDLAARILLTAPGITHVRADERSGAPQAALGDWFFFAETDERMPFATIVTQDTPGFDEDSLLDRPGVFRLNIGVGRVEFERLFGFPPAQLADRRDGFDFAELDRLVPHPAYGRQGWASILNPSVERLTEVDRLVTLAHRRALGRRR